MRPEGKTKRLLASMGKFEFLSRKMMKKHRNRWLTLKLVGDYWLLEFGRKDGVFGPDDDVWFKGLFRGMSWFYRPPEIGKVFYRADREMALVFERTRFIVRNRTTGEEKIVKIPDFFRRLIVSLVEIKQVKALPEKTCKALGISCAE